MKRKSNTDDHFVLGGDSAADLEDLFRRNPDQLIKEKYRKEMLRKSKCLKIGKGPKVFVGNTSDGGTS